MKKLFIILGSLIGLIIVALVVVPLVVDVDKFRPQIVKAANEKINGSLELGKLSLSLWGKIHVSVDGLRVLDAQKNQIVGVKDAAFDSSYVSIFSGAPLVTMFLMEPEISVIKNKDGKLNVMSLMKETPAAAPGQPQATGSAELPSMVVNAHIGVSIENAKLVYKDQAMALSNTIDKLNVRVKDFSLSRKTEVEVWADLKTQMGTDLTVAGPLKFNAELSPVIVNGEFKSGSVNANFSADDLDVQKGQLFHKKKGVLANVKMVASLDQTTLKLTEAVLKFHNAEVLVKGAYDKTAGADIHFETKPVDLKSWSDLVPMLKEYELEGKLTLSGDVKGKPEALAYDAKLGIDNLSAKGPNLKAKPIINGLVTVKTDQIEHFLVDLKGPGNELVLDGKLVSFTKPSLTFKLTSAKGLDLDQWIEFPKKDPKVQAKEKEDAKVAKSEKAQAQDLDASIDPIRKNEMIRNMMVDGTVSIAFLKAMGMRIDDIAAKVQFKNLVAGLTGIKMKLFDGALAANFSTDLKPAQPQYSMDMSLAGFDLSKAVESQMQSLKNTVVGKLSFSAKGGGSSFNTEAAKKHLQMKGEFKLLGAQFKSIDVAKMANDAINGSVSKIADKVPFLKGKDLHVSSNADSKYEYMSGHFVINNGVLDLPDFVAKAEPKRGIDLRGTTKVGLIDESLDAKWELIDAQKVTSANQLTVNVAGKDIHNFLAKSETDPVIIPVSVGCKYTAPCPSYTAAPEYLAGVAAGRLSNVAKDVLKAKATDALKAALPGGFKKLFGH